MKKLELFDGCTIMVETKAETPEDFLKEVPTRRDDINGDYFFYNNEWFPAFDLDFI